jgi:CDP-glucose 4,6-dehydratase
VVVITTDKVYENREWAWGYREVDQLGGSDPYSASKACAELVTTSFRRSFFTSDGGPGVTAVASARAGNVIGGGDWAADRIIPDFVRAIASGQPVRLRNPGAVRPWQHVIESLSGYITLAGLLLGDHSERRLAAQEWNFGPQPASGTATVLAIAEQCCAAYGSGTVEVGQADPAAKESQLLTLCIDKAEQQLGWRPRWSVTEAVKQTMSWYRQVADGADAGALCRAQLASYLAG